MSEQQDFANHAKLVPAFHFFVIPVLLVNLVSSVGLLYGAARHGWGALSLFHAIWNVILAVALIVLAFLARLFALGVQDRVIRLEMRQRLREVLPAALQARINDFTRGQLVALRFASDGELGELAQTVLRDNITDRKAIKQMIKTWNADHLRV